MNVLYISNLTGNLFAGPNNSVPAQIKAQSKRDNVFWYNINDIKREEWKEINCYNLKDYPSGRLKDLPKPFNKPDIAVIEEFYCFPFCKIIKDINENKIPYIIIPRSELTKKAQKRKRVKKFIGNICYFKKFIDFDNPKTFNEKIQWLKLNYRKEEYTNLVDKYRVKQYITKLIGEEYVIPTLGVWNNVDDIDFKSLPEKFVLKCNFSKIHLSIYFIKINSR